MALAMQNPEGAVLSHLHGATPRERARQPARNGLEIGQDALPVVPPLQLHCTVTDVGVGQHGRIALALQNPECAALSHPHCANQRKKRRDNRQPTG